MRVCSPCPANGLSSPLGIPHPQPFSLGEKGVLLPSLREGPGVRVCSLMAKGDHIKNPLPNGEGERRKKNPLTGLQAGAAQIGRFDVFVFAQLGRHTVNGNFAGLQDITVIGD